MANPKLNQVVAVEKSIKNKVSQELTEAHHALQKPALMSGLSRSFTSNYEKGAELYEELPSENSKVQVSASDMLRRTQEILTNLLDITATKDHANTIARADVVVDGAKLLEQVPVTHLLFLEKQLNDVYTFVRKLPVLDPSEKWTFDPTTNCYSTAAVETNKTKRVKKVLVKAAATDKHPAQTEVYDEDVVTGRWRVTKFSGSLPQSEITAMLERVQKLQQAVKFAREDANSQEAPKQFEGKKVFDYLFGTVASR